LLDIRGFNPNATLEIEPDLLTDVDHEHDVFQRLHRLMGSGVGAAWKPGELRDSKRFFISRDRPEDVLPDGLAECVASSAPRPAQR
jgi:hypothetical protein